jgi:pimeloyl-ACP methyl ester carboxylesterase
MSTTSIESPAENTNSFWFTGRVEQRRVQTSKGPVEYADVGQGVPVLYFHGNGVGCEAAVMLEKSLLDDGCRLIVPNRPGYFGTPLTSGRSFKDCADLAAELLDQLGVERAIVIGTSGGGPPASRFAARHPQKTNALVLQCALSHHFDAGRWLPGGHRFLLPIFRHFWLFRPMLRMANRKQAANPNFLAAAMSKARYAEVRDTPALKSLAPLLTRAMVRCCEQPEGTENDWSNWTGEPWLTPGAVTRPTLILHDRADAGVPFAHAEWAQQCIPGAQLCELNLGGHMVWIGRDREKMRRERAAFIKRHAA